MAYRTPSEPPAVAHVQYTTVLFGYHQFRQILPRIAAEESPGWPTGAVL